VGTLGYMPEAGLGTPAADIYGLGIVLYRMSTGLEAARFPALPETLFDRSDLGQLMALNEIMLTACARAPAKRYPSAAALRGALLELKRRLDEVRPDAKTL
jgi:eukaryotic-like serine/threonine-protein kinase